ncbi:NUDIX domain-containing protein [Candidatus Amarobacter glycogenicus]|uniref:NUDIX domain-containing protein n=1 Tax=Candidatus Amarobacter glycogenicus TaxID=3140699 RepID=UPI003135F92B|nr:NUDIX domain-containing protein [Dehalococcoidia bacterium]
MAARRGACNLPPRPPVYSDPYGPPHLLPTLLHDPHDQGGRRTGAPGLPSCDYIHYGDFSIGCSGVVIRDGKALLVQRGWQPFAGSWQIPGGYAEHDEPLSLAVEREVLEEAGIEARVRDVIAFRHAIGGGMGGPTTNIYVMFRLDPLGNEEPRFDGDRSPTPASSAWMRWPRWKPSRAFRSERSKKACRTGEGWWSPAEPGASPGVRAGALRPPALSPSRPSDGPAIGFTGR